MLSTEGRGSRVAKNSKTLKITNLQVAEKLPKLWGHERIPALAAASIQVFDK
jgi:hypothetical protein